MCLIIFAHQLTPEYPLVVAANRDEFHARPTAASRFWSDQPTLLAGKDLDQGGTWMGITRGGRFAAVTNFRDPSRTAAAPRSRGELTLNFLLGQHAPATYLEEIARAGDQYAGFNLLIGDRSSLWYFSNSESRDGLLPRQLSPGIYGLSNALLDTPWPKVETGKLSLAQTMKTPPSHQALATAVSSRTLASPAQLTAQELHGDMEQLLSAQFIINGQYGTRATTTLWTDSKGNAKWREQSFAAGGADSGVVELGFALRESAIPPGCE